MMVKRKVLWKAEIELVQEILLNHDAGEGTYFDWEKIAEEVIYALFEKNDKVQTSP